jgi:sarcosine oxidase subunit alpha
VLAPGAPFAAGNDQGYLTSACFSPTLGHDVALGFVRDGRARIGEGVRAVCALRGFDTACVIAAPAFVDPEGGRMRG